MNSNKIDKYCIQNNTRPNLHKLSETELLEIINHWDNLWYFTQTRSEMVDKIFQLWADYQLMDNHLNQINCLICWDYLTNGNNITFECGHKFHSSCIIKSTLISSIDKYIEFSKDSEKHDITINYCCPQCNKIIESSSWNKNNV